MNDTPKGNGSKKDHNMINCIWDENLLSLPKKKPFAYDTFLIGKPTKPSFIQLQTLMMVDLCKQQYDYGSEPSQMDC